MNLYSFSLVLGFTLFFLQFPLWINGYSHKPSEWWLPCLIASIIFFVVAIFLKYKEEKKNKETNIIKKESASSKRNRDKNVAMKYMIISLLLATCGIFLMDGWGVILGYALLIIALPLFAIGIMRLNKS